MPKPNYSFAKRQRELQKKQKKEAKLQERAAEKAKASGETGDAPVTPPPETPGS
jgi:hypothetical protein